MENRHHRRPRKHVPVLRTWKFWSAVLVIATIGGLSYYYEEVKDEFPWLISLQLWTFGQINRASQRIDRPKFVVGVEVDNPSFFGPPMNRKGPEDITDRRFLAHVIDNAVKARADLIALDINLVPEETNAESDRQHNQILGQAIDNAANSGIPVVLTFAFDVKTDRPLNLIFKKDKVAICEERGQSKPVRAGFDNAPEDMRKVPLVVDGRSQNGKLKEACRSFALQIADAYEQRYKTGRGPLDRLAEPIENRQFVYSPFLQRDEFDHVSALAVYDEDPEALHKLTGRVVLIGGNRTAWPTEDPDPPIADRIDYHPSPVGQMAGMYFHANYAEAILDDNYKVPVPRDLATLIDMNLAAAIILALEALAGIRRLLAICGLIFVPVLIAYIAYVNFGYYFDSALPVVLSFLHPAVERYLEIPYDLLRRHSDEPHPNH